MCRLAAACLAAAASAQGAWAQQRDAAGVLRQYGVIERQQQDRLREEQERALQLQPVRPGGADLKSMQPQVSVPDLGAPCRDINEIRIEGATLLPGGVREQIARDYAGRCLAAKDLEAVLAAVTKFYIDKGYVTTRAYLPAQDLRSGTLAVMVVEGRIERYEVRNTGRTGAAVSTRGAFPGAPGDRLNLRDLEQGIDQINGVASNSATLDLQPGSQPGQSVVVVNNTAGTPAHLYATYDTLGTPSTGKNSLSATVSFDSLLGLNEVIAITRRQSVPHDGEHNSDLTALRASVPWGYSTLSYDANESNYTNTLQLASGNKLASQGRTLTQAFTLDRVVFRDQASRLSLSGRLQTQDSRSFLAGQFLEVASRKLTTLDIGANAFTQLGSSIVNARLGYVGGLRGLGALEDPAYLPADLPHAQFEKYTLDAGFSSRFDVGSQPLAWSTQFSGQYSPYVLYGVQQMLIGGWSSVRGSLLNSLSGDSGYFVRNELSLPWQVTAAQQPLSGRVYLGYDFGRVSNNAPELASGSMSGATVGMALHWRSLSAEVFASRALHLPSYFSNESTLYGVRLSFAL